MKILKSCGRFMWMFAALVPTYLQAEIQYNTYMPGTHQTTINTAKLGEVLASQTDGELAISVLSGGSVASGKATLSFISDRLVDAGLVTDVYVPGDLPHTVIASSMALLGENAWVMSGAMTEYSLLGCKGCKQDLDKLGVMNFGHHSTSPYKLLCNTDVSTVADLKGKKIKAAAPWTRLVASWGAVPLNIPFNDVYEGLQRGQMNCAFSPESAMEDYGLYDVLSHVVDFPGGTFHGFHSFVLNRDVWESFTEEQQAILLKEIPHFIASNTAAYFESSRVSREKAIESGIKYLPATEELKETIAKARQEEKENSLAIARKRGVKNPEDNVKVFLEAVDKWTALIGDQNPTPEEFSDMLVREVYSKVKFN
ncbi:C4-dicarboxylate TRAP transporter substrate-binding protein [Marinobacter sp. F3R11]|uniref:C4-dicarboxylate TRAP transporter substrate-binding protein n=1 Tax=Marinobacter sp. F3R11 TaxID=2267231 RepID=UPI000DE85CC3|nr:C4-dicarboxylate TRAP transporter substrate-binding protein [Marinobacter sp. F3R11]RBW51215.1 hypothetical protein DS878_03645 [Marinobacter sp. F3R11]